MFTIVFRNLNDLDGKPEEVYIWYYMPLGEALEKFNETREEWDQVKVLYNRYGQELPLTYEIQKSGWEVYYNG